MCEVSSLYVKRKWSYRSEMVKMVKSLKSEFDLDLWPIDPKINRSPSQVMVNTSVKYHYCMLKINGVMVWKRYKVKRPNMTLPFDPLTPKNQ